MPGQGRLGDKAHVSVDAHGCPGCPHPGTGPGISGSTNVLINGRPALRVGDAGIHAACCGPNTWTAQSGAPSVFINGKAAFRMNDVARHCGGVGKLIEGSPDVIVGNGGSGGGGGRRTGSSGGEANGTAGPVSGGATGPAAQLAPAPTEPAAEPPKITLRGVFKHEERVMPETRFLLRRNSVRGTPLTPSSLDGGQSDNPHRDGYWIADGGGSYLFREMMRARYFIEPELGAGGAPPAADDREAETCGAEGGPDGVIWVALFDDAMARRLTGMAYRIQLADGAELSGTTDEHGELRHERVATGMYAVLVGESEGCAPSRPARFADAAYAVRVSGAEARS